MIKNSNKYFKKRKITDSIFEENYWGKVKDPDGNERNLLEEHDKKIEDLKDEISYINKLSGGKVLDIGCGLGTLMSSFGDQWEKYGVEISDFAGKKASKFGKVYIGDLKSANFESDFFDAITMYHVIEHMEDPIAEMTEIYRILKIGGSLILGTPNFGSICAKRFGDNFRLLHDKTHISLFTYESLKMMLEDFSFEIEKVEFPFFETRYFTKENLMRLFDTTKTSPPFYGNIMTFYCRKI